MPTFATPHDTSLSGQGTVLGLTLNGAYSTYTVSNIQLSYSNPNAGNNDTTLNVGHLGQTTGETEARMDRPLIVPSTQNGNTTGRQISFNYIGKVIINDAATGTYQITVAGVTLAGGSTGSFHTVQSSQLTLALNDVIRGQATLTLAR